MRFDRIITDAATYQSAIDAANANAAKRIGASMIADVSVTAKMVQPANLVVTPLRGAMFVVSGGGHLEFLGEGLDRATLKGKTPVFKIAKLSRMLHFFPLRSITAVNLNTNTITSPNHGFQHGQQLTYRGGTKPIKTDYLNPSGSGLQTASNGILYVVNRTKDTFQVATSWAGAGKSRTPAALMKPLNLTEIGNLDGAFTMAYFGTYILPAANAFSYDPSLGAHGLADGAKVKYWTEKTAVGGLTIGRSYYVRNATTLTFQLSATPTGAIIDFADGGFGGDMHYIAESDISFAGIAPTEISAELWDTGNAFHNDRLACASAALVGKKATIFTSGRLMNPRPAFINEFHTVDLGGGKYPSNFNGGVEEAPMILYPNAKIHGRGATIHESSVLERTRVITTFHHYGDMRSTQVRDLIVEGGKEKVDQVDQYNAATINVGNSSTGFLLENIKFYNSRSYSLQFGQYGDNGFVAKNGLIRNIEFHDCRSQSFFTPNALNCKVENVKFYYTKNFTYLSVPIDIEPNSRYDRVERLIFDGLEAFQNATGAFGAFISLNSVDTKGLKDITIRNFKLAGNYWTKVGIGALGVYKLTLENCEVIAARDCAFLFNNCGDVNLINCTARKIGIGNEERTRAAAIFIGCRNVDVDGLRTVNQDNTETYATDIVEYDNELLIKSVRGNTFTLSTDYGGEHINFKTFATVLVPEIWLGGRIIANNQECTIIGGNFFAEGSHTSAEYAPRTIVTDKTFPAIQAMNCAIDSASAVVTMSGTHNYATGAAVQLSKGDFIVDNAGKKLSTYINCQYVIRVSATQLKLASTLENALGNIPLPLPGASGIYTLVPVIQTRFSKNSTYKNIDGRVVRPKHSQSRLITNSSEADIKYLSPPAGYV